VVLTGLLAFVAASFLIAMSPGPATVLLLRQSVRGSRRTVLATVAGIEAGVLMWAVAAVFGLSAVLVASRMAYDVLRLIGAGVLIWFGVQTLRSVRASVRAQSTSDTTTETVGTTPVEVDRPHRAFRMGLLTNATNPKLGVFALSFLPQFVPSELSPQTGLLLIAGVWVLVDTLWYLVIAATLHRLGRWIRRARVRRRLEQVSGSVLIALGIQVALTSR